MPVDGGIGGVDIEMRGVDLRDLAPGRQLGWGDVAPVRPTVLGQPYQAVIRTGPQGVDVARRESEGVDHAALFLRPRGVQCADARGQYAGFAREVRADRLPRQTAVASLVQVVGRVEQRVGIER